MKRWAAAMLVFGTVAVAQNAAQTSNQRHKPVDKQLTLTLSVEQNNEASGSTALQTCLIHHPPIACRLLALTVKNEGTDTILVWRDSCGYGQSLSVRKADGNWELFPMDYENMPVCLRSTIDVTSLSPGQTQIERFRLSDYNLRLDTAYPPPDDERIHPHHPGYALLVANGPHVLRVNWGAYACIASDKLKADSAPSWPSAQSYCAEDAGPQYPVILVSNELDIPPQ